MNNPPRISIVTPSYQQGQFIEETICSVLDQEYTNLEYIIIDGGSTDKSVDVISKYADHLAYWVSEPDRGQSHAINKGFFHFTGDIFAWLNSDDVYLPGTFSKVAEYFINHSEVDLMYGDAEIIDPAGNFIMHRKELQTDYGMGNLIGWGFLIPQPAAFWQRRVYQNIGGVDESINYALDYDYWQRIAGNGVIRHVSQLFARQRYHADAKTLHMPDDPRYRDEIDLLRRTAYSRVGISKLFPYRFSGLFRRVYRIKRIFMRMMYGHYFKGYVPDAKLRKAFKAP